MSADAWQFVKTARLAAPGRFGTHLSNSAPYIFTRRAGSGARWRRRSAESKRGVMLLSAAVMPMIGHIGNITGFAAGLTGRSTSGRRRRGRGNQARSAGGKFRHCSEDMGFLPDKQAANRDKVTEIRHIIKKGSGGFPPHKKRGDQDQCRNLAKFADTPAAKR